MDTPQSLRIRLEKEPKLPILSTPTALEKSRDMDVALAERYPTTDYHQQLSKTHNHNKVEEYSKYEDLPPDLKSYVLNAGVNGDQARKHFRILCIALRFVLKRRVRYIQLNQPTTTTIPTPPLALPNPITSPPISPRTSGRAPGVGVGVGGEALEAGLRQLIPERFTFLMDPEELLEQNVSVKDYKIVHHLGNGGFGKVFLGQNRMSKKNYAIKAMSHSAEKSRQSNLLEIAMLRFCRHPNIVALKTAFLVKEEVWLVMEYISGSSLHQAATKMNFRDDEIAAIVVRVLEALSFLHLNHIVHRDVKSENIMISPKGSVKLSSPFFVAPEVILLQPHDTKLDIWSLGMVILEVLKRGPLEHTSLRLIFEVATQGMDSRLNSDLTGRSPALVDFVTRCLVFDPALRATADELLKHPFLGCATTKKGLEELMDGLFVSSALSMFD